MLETIGSQLSPGAGRTLDLVWPPPMQKLFGSAPSNNMAVRTNGWFLNGVPTWSITRTGALSAELGVIYNGATSARFTGATANGTGVKYTSGDILGWKPRLSKLGGVPAACDDYAVTRVYANMAFLATPSVDADFGYQLCCQPDDTGGGIIQNTVGGIGWNKMASGLVALIIQGAGFNVFPFNPPGFDQTALHCYELRIISATATTDATLKAFVDNQLFQVFSWGAGSILPLVNNAYPQMNTHLVNLCGAGGVMHMQQFRAMTAPTEVGIV